jgi:gamma-glutamyltranspeptidase / glutathione hydrolase
MATLLEPAIRFPATGFEASGYLVNTIHDAAGAIARFPAIAEVFLPDGRPPRIGQLIVRRDYAPTLQQIADEGPDTLYTGALAHTVVEDLRANGGLITLEDLAN